MASSSRSMSRIKWTHWLLVTCSTLTHQALMVQAQQPAATTDGAADCFTSSNIVGAVLGTFFATAVVLGFFFCLLWWICGRRQQQRRRSLIDDGQAKSAHGVESGAGFDNPCFEAHPPSDVVDGSKPADDKRKDVGKSTSWTPLRFFGSSKKRSMDDSFVSEPERVSVQLRGHDFTGLGFNVTGNMRDGIFIKDILNRGPAFESGKIAQGDRILTVTISFRHVVYEDALTILSYASPYDVTLELEKGQQRNNSMTLKQQRVKAASSVSLGAASSSSSASASAGTTGITSSPDATLATNERLIHPLYRSQSIDDLSKVKTEKPSQKETFPPVRSSPLSMFLSNVYKNQVGRADTSIGANVRVPTLIKTKMLTKSASAYVEAPEIKVGGKAGFGRGSVVVDTGDISVAPPDVSVTVPESITNKPSKLAKFGIKVLPDFKFNRGSIKNPDLNLTDLPTGLATPVEAEVTLPKVEIHVPKPTNVAIDIDLPDVDSSLAASGDASVAIDMPDLQAVPDVNLDINAPLTSLSSDFTGPELSVKGPQLDVNLPTVNLSKEISIPNPEISAEIPKEVKSGFHVKLPKFGGGGIGGSKSVKVEVPETEISAPSIQVDLPDAPRLEVKTKDPSTGKAGFEFKMPKLSVKKKVDAPRVTADVTAPTLQVNAPSLEGSLDVEAGLQPPTVEASIPSVEAPSIVVEAKKGKTGFSMPKWSLGKGQSDPTKDSSASVELGVDVPTAHVDLSGAGATVALSDDDETEGAKKKSKFSLKMPKMPKKPKGGVDINLSTPKIGVSHASPEEADDENEETGGKTESSKMSITLPTLPKAEIDLSLPSAELSLGASETDGSAKKKGGKFGAEIKLEDSDSDDDSGTAAAGKKKASSKFGFKMPKLSKPEADINVELPSLSVAAQGNADGHDNDDTTKLGVSGNLDVNVPEGEIGIKLPSPTIGVEVKGNEADDEGASAKTKKSSKFSLKMPKMSKGELDVSLPKVNAELKSPTSDDSDDEDGKKKSAKFGLKMPKLPKGEVDLDVSLPKLSVESSKPQPQQQQDETSDDENGASSKKRSSKFSLKMPKWNVNKPHSDLVLEGVEGKIQMGAEIDTSGEMRMSDIGSDEDEGGNKKRGGKFSIKMPKFGMNKPHVQTEGPDAVVAEVGLPKVNVEPVAVTVGSEAEIGKKKSKFGFKMPKLGATATGPDVEVHADVARDINLAPPSVDVKIHTESSSEDEGDGSAAVGDADKKKKRFHIKMPKFGGVKTHLETDVPKVEVCGIADTVDPLKLKSTGGSGGLELDVSVPSVSLDVSGASVGTDNTIDVALPKVELNKPQVDLDFGVASSMAADEGSSSNDGDEHKESKKKFNIKMPTFGFSGSAKAPSDMDVTVATEPISTDVNVDLPHVDVSTEHKTKKKGTKFGIKLPGLHFDKPNVEVSGDSHDPASTSSSEDEDENKTKGAKMSINLPKLSLSKELGSSEERKLDDISGSLPAVKLEGELKAPKLTAGAELAEGDDDEETSKKSGKFSIKMPKFSLSKPHASAEVRGDIAVPHVGVEVEGKAPKLDVEANFSDGEGDDKKKSSKFGIKMPKLQMKKMSSDLDADIDKDASLHVDINAAASGDADASPSDDESHEKKKGGKFSIKMPKFNVKKPHLDVDLSLEGKEISVEGESGIIGAAIPEFGLDVKDGGDQKKELFEVQLPGIDLEKPHLDLGGAAVSLPTIEVRQPEVQDIDVKLPSVEVPTADVSLSANVDLPKLPALEGEHKKKSKFGIDMGKMGFTKPSVEVKASGGTVDLPKVPELNVNLPSASIHVDEEIPKLEIEAGAGMATVDDDKKKGGKFTFKMPKFHMGKAHGELKLDSKIDVPTGAEMDVDPVGLEVDLPSVAVDLAGAKASTDDADSGDDEKKDNSKKKTRFGIKMPKFHMNKPHPPGVDIKTEDVNLDIKVDPLSLEADVKAAADPSEVNIDLPKVSADLDLSLPEGKLELHDKEAKAKKGKFSFKMPKLHAGSSKNDTDLKLEFDASIPKVELPEKDVKIELTKEESSKKSPFIVKMPEFIPEVDVDLSKPRIKLDSDDSSSDSQDDQLVKGKTQIDVKIPQLPSIGASAKGLEVTSPTVDISVPDNASAGAQCAVEGAISLPDVTVPDVKKRTKLGFKMPSLPGVKAQGDVSIPEVPEIHADLQTVTVEVGGEHEGEAAIDSSDDEHGNNKSRSKFGIKVPKFHFRQRGADVVLPQVELKAETDLPEVEEDAVKVVNVEAKKPKFGIKLPAMPDLQKPKVKVEMPQVEVAQPEGLELPQGELTVKTPSVSIGRPDVNVNVGNIDVTSSGASQVEGGRELGVGLGKADETSSDSEDEKKSKSSGFNVGLKMPKFSLTKEKLEPEVKVDVDVSSPSVKNLGDEITAPSGSLEVEPVKLESSDKEKKKFSLKMPKFQSKTATLGADVDAPSIDATAETKPFKIGLKAPKKDKKKKKDDSNHSDHSDDEDEDKDRAELSTAASNKLIEAEVKLPRVQVYKNVEYHDAEKETRDSSSDEEDEVKDIKKNIGARFGVKLKKPKMFSSSKAEISSKNEPGSSANVTAATAFQPEWKLPRVDLRRTSKSADQELTVDVNLDADSSGNLRLEQLSPSERAEAIRRDSKASAGIRLHSPSYISQMMPSPRSKKSSLELLDVESSPKLLSVTRLDPTPPIESSSTTQPVYGASVEVTASATGPQISASDIPSSVFMASEAVKFKRGPPTPARRSMVDPNSSLFRVPLPTEDPSDLVAAVLPTSVEVPTVSAEVEVGVVNEPRFGSNQEQQASDTDISVTTSTGSEMLVITNAVQPSTGGQQEGSNRKASSLGDLTRIPTSGNDDTALERTVSLDFKPVSAIAGSSSRAIYNLAVQDLSRVGEDSDEDYSLNTRKRSTNYDNLVMDVNAPVETDDAPATRPTGTSIRKSLSTSSSSSSSSSSTSSEEFSNRSNSTNQTALEVDQCGDNVSLQPAIVDSAEALWFGSTSIQTVESVQTTVSYSQMEESISATDVTMTTTSLGTSPSETSSSSAGNSPTSPASPEPGNNNDEPQPDLINQVENGSGQQYHTEFTEIRQEEVFTTTAISRTITVELTTPLDDSQPQPLTDLNPSAGSFAAVRNRFEQLSGNVNGAEVTALSSTTGTGSPSTRRPSQGGSVVKRLSGTFEDPSMIQKSFVQHMVPEVSEGALSRTVIISSLQLERSEQNSAIIQPSSGVGPESPVPNLEPPC